MEGVVGGTAILGRCGVNFGRPFHSELKREMSPPGQEAGGPWKGGWVAL